MGRVVQLARRAAARFIPGAGLPVQCGGCGVRMAEGVLLVAGPRVYLCGDCIGRAASQLAPRQPPVDGLLCRFCMCLRPPVDVTSVGAVTVCAECLGRMEVVLTRPSPADSI